MNRLKLTTQVNIIFSFVTLLGCLVFLFILNLSFNQAYEYQNMLYLTSYYKSVEEVHNPSSQTFNYDDSLIYNDHFVIKDGVVVSSSTDYISIEDLNMVIDIILRDYFKPSDLFTLRNITYTRLGKIAYMGKVVDPVMNPKYAIIVISNASEYISDMTGNVPFYATLAFLNILVLGNVIIWLWSGSAVKKIKILQDVVDQMIKDDYETKVVVEGGSEEIRGLADAIDNMRQEIKNNEDTKKEMIQNLGHDLKTPIAVIKSYAEAILDGIEDKESASLIVKQSDVLNKKVKQIIEYSKIGYMDLNGPLEEVSFKEIIMQVVNHYKYITDANFILDLETDWKHQMIKENVYVAISNIIDNAVRYVKSKIVIQLKNKKLTIFNDGEHIEPSVLPKIFKAYEKGSKGQFGLGLAIVKETMDRFGLKVDVTNHANGVLFTIELQ